MATYGRLTTSRPKTTHHTSRQRSRGGYDDYSRQAAPRPETSYNTHPQHPPRKNGSSSRRTTSRPVTSHHTDQEAPHSSRNVNTNHHTACLVSFDDQPLTFVQHSRARRPDVYDVPEALQNIMKLDDGVISKRLKKRLCSAGRVYCGNNILNLHKRMHERPRPGSSQYQWSSTKCTMLLPTIVRGPARAKTAGPARNRNSDPEGGCPRPWTAVEKKRNNSPEPDTRDTTGTKETESKGQEKEGKDRENARETNANTNTNTNAKAKANANTKTNANANANANANVNVHVNDNLNAKRDSSSQSSDSSSGSDSSSNSDSSSSDEEQREDSKANTPSQKKKKANMQRRSVSENKSGKNTDPKQHVPGRDGNQRNDGARFSKPRGLNSDDDYSTDSSESSRDDKGK